MSAAAAAAGVNISAVTRRPVGGATALSGNTVVVTPGGARWSAGGGGKGVAPRLAWTPSPAWFVPETETSGGAVASMQRPAASSGLLH